MNDEKDYKYTAYNSALLPSARTLRKTMTPQEKHLWYDFLKSYPVKIYKQRPIGSYIADFYCSKARLVIEIDGSQHYTEEGKDYDDNRTEVINQFGVDVIRFSNHDINTNFDGVCTEIDKEIRRRLGVEAKFR